MQSSAEMHVRPPRSNDATLLEHFEHAVRNHPEKPALRMGDATLTFEALDQAANGLAAELQRRGYGPSDVIGVYLHRSFGLSICAFAILKIGATYLPLDTALPDARISFVLRDSSAVAVLTSEDVCQAFAALDVDVLAVEPFTEPAARAGATFAGHHPGPDDTLYIVYTSGSTGAPKGVQISHRQTLNRFNWLWSTFPFRPADVYAQKTSIGFVDSIWEVFGVLAGGCTAAVIPENVSLDVHLFVSLLQRHRVTRIWLVPTLLQVLLEYVDDLPKLVDLTHWVATGEPLLKSTFDNFSRRMAHAELHNLYGSSEFGDVTWWRPSDGLSQRGKIPIGRPIANISCFLVNQAGKIAEPGEAGELVVASDGLPRGYLNRPELTAERFGHLHVEGRGLLHIGKTGDICQQTDDGIFELIGRVDRQIKIHGVRIEPAEIETVLQEIPEVAQATIIAILSGDHEQMLVAFVALKPGQTIAPETLRRKAAERLPSAFVPAEIILRTSFPTTRSGKTDRIALEKIYLERRPGSAPAGARHD